MPHGYNQDNNSPISGIMGIGFGASKVSSTDNIDYANQLKQNREKELKSTPVFTFAAKYASGGGYMQ